MERELTVDTMLYGLRCPTTGFAASVGIIFVRITARHRCIMSKILTFPPEML